jgi:pimeloyl-ACP methyl ester carboxylesterase
VAWAANGDCRLWYETFGDRAHPTLLMVNGLGSQSINYADDWCALFAARGLYVIRFDNRDVGLSTSFADAPVGERGNAYTLSDMAADGMAVLDAEGIDRAHVMGLSMGGMIVQTMAIEHPDRLLSATSVMSRTGEAGYGDSTPEAFALLTAPPATDREDYVRSSIAGLRCWGSPAFADEARWRADAERAYDRAFRPDGTRRQFLAVGASGSRGDALRTVRVPFLVMHGSADTLITPSGGERTAELVPDARFVLIEGMGHDYPPQLWQRWVDEVAGFIESLASA